jgi:hypothetical protein
MRNPGLQPGECRYFASILVGFIDINIDTALLGPYHRTEDVKHTNVYYATIIIAATAGFGFVEDLLE